MYMIPAKTWINWRDVRKRDREFDWNVVKMFYIV